jgi:hypothetical protein
MEHKNAALNNAGVAKEDEFYTQLSDIENELGRYPADTFAGKSVLCNCDDPYESNFFKYFAINFKRLGLRKLTATCYSGSPVLGEQLSLFNELGPARQPYKATITDADDTGLCTLPEIEHLMRYGRNNVELLRGDGDFRSEECIGLLKDADIVVTNPPFSLWREYVARLMEYGKKFIIVGSQNNVTYKEIFPLIKQNKIWLGYHAGDMAFRVPKYYEPRETRFWTDHNGQKWRSLGNICWFTNVDIRKRHEPIILCRDYAGHESEYPKYDNYDAINISKVADIPEDYYGAMGVPITFLDRYDPEQFEILDSNDFISGNVKKKATQLIKDKDSAINGKPTYARILIRRIKEEK